MPAKYWLQAKPLIPGSLKSVVASRLVVDLNQKIIIPKFTCTHPAWDGASMIAARTKLNIGTTWSIKQPVTMLDDCVLCIKWVTDGVVYRYKLYDNANAKVNFPHYYGEVIPANSVLEFWTIDGEIRITLTEDYTLYATAFDNPTELYDTTPTTLFTATDTCATFSAPVPVTWEGFMSHCL